MELLERLSGIDEVITETHLYLKQINSTRRFSFGTWTSRQHVFLSVKAGGETGWGENIITVNQPDVSLDQWQQWVGELVGKSVSDAIIYLRSKLEVWQDRMTEMTEMSLIDLAGKLKKVNALKLLGLSGEKPVYGVFVILSDDLDYVEKQVLSAISCGQSRYIKVKLFGNVELDEAVIKTVRKHLSKEETYLVGDVNCGYRPENQLGDVETIGEYLKVLYIAGLDACEDPAWLNREEWVELQKLTGSLALIPDYPMRPARKAVHTICAGMGEIYNIHPGSAASLLDAIVLAEKIRDIGGGLMIGDDSLVGPGCTIWQQMAVGLSANWVEAVEKQGDSDFYYECVEKLSTDSGVNPIAVDTEAYGFGVYLNEERIREMTGEA